MALERSRHRDDDDEGGKKKKKKKRNSTSRAGGRREAKRDSAGSAFLEFLNAPLPSRFRPLVCVYVCACKLGGWRGGLIRVYVPVALSRG